MRTIIYILAIGLGLQSMQGQQTVAAAGGDATGDGGTLSFTVGQVVYTAVNGINGSASQGVQQAYTVETLTVVKPELSVAMAVFPNPVTDQLSIRTNDFDHHKLSYQLFDLQGKLLRKGRITSQETSVNMTDLPITTYLMYIVNEHNKRAKTFKIIKN